MHRLYCFVIIICGVINFAYTPTAAQTYLPPTANLLLRYDTNGDGIVSRAEIEAGLETDYQLADANGDDCIDSGEMRRENERRLQRDGSVASPIADWNLDGCVDGNEFGSSIRSYFNYADRDKDGLVTTVDLQGPSMPITPPLPPSAQQEQPPMGTRTLEQNPYDPTLPGNY